MTRERFDALEARLAELSGTVFSLWELVQAQERQMRALQARLARLQKRCCE